MSNQHVYSTIDVKRWDVERSDKFSGYWPARPLNHKYIFWDRVKAAWGVLIGRYDALWWIGND